MVLKGIGKDTSITLTIFVHVEKERESRDYHAQTYVSSDPYQELEAMEGRERSFLGLLLLLAAFGPSVAVDSNCMELGYTSGLMCSSCRELREFNLKDLEEECDQCCQPDGTNADDKVRNSVYVYMCVL